MSIHTNDLRDHCGLLGDTVADELEALEDRYYSLLTNMGNVKAMAKVIGLLSPSGIAAIKADSETADFYAAMLSLAKFIDAQPD